MSTRHSLLKAFKTIGMALTLGVSMSACATSTFTWKEEVLLHDGQKIIVKRSQSYGGRHEPSKDAPVKEHTITFTLPGSDKTRSWTSEYGEELGRANFNLLALHLLNGTPYLVVEPNLCLSYNKWGRPNPPYVFFKYDGLTWQRIPLSALPAEFKDNNLIINNRREEDIEKLASKLGYVPAKSVQEINSSLTQPEYKTILRVAYAGAGRGCGEMIRTGDGGWNGIGWFSKQPSKDACLKYCEREKVLAQDCPCNTLFKGAK